MLKMVLAFLLVFGLVGTLYASPPDPGGTGTQTYMSSNYNPLFLAGNGPNTFTQGLQAFAALSLIAVLAIVTGGAALSLLFHTYRQPVLVGTRSAPLKRRLERTAIPGMLVNATDEDEDTDEDGSFDKRPGGVLKRRLMRLQPQV